ncbi:protein kinase domain-containing protein [Legionella sp. CNM-4043-24]|uniref:protein kinase domain-containing protein n=1 Tax=Legionella sp. CNM-4043-24 TaxID=3421646 RepID=UPI00403AB8F7
MAGLTIKPRIAMRLYQALQKEHNETGRTVWHSGTSVRLGKKWFFRLHYDVIGRRRESDQAEPRFEWIKKLRNFEQDSNLNIYPVEGTLTPKGLKKRGYIGKRGLKKTRLIKHRLHNGPQHPLTNADMEYNMAQLSGHIRMKRPVIIRNGSLLVMKQFPGKELYNLLYETPVALTTHQQITLTRNLLSAYRQQVYNAGLVHRDIKPENIIVDLNSDGQVEVNIIDFGLSTEAGAYDRMAGTYGYLPPELFKGLKKQHVSQDIFSLACVIAEIWGVNRDSIIKIDNIYQTQAARQDPGDWRALLRFLHGRGVVPCQSASEQIFQTLYSMLDPNPETRLKLHEAEAAFLDIERILNSQQERADFQQAESSVATRRMPRPPSGCLPASYDDNHRFFSTATQKKSMEENEHLPRLDLSPS